MQDLEHCLNSALAKDTVHSAVIIGVSRCICGASLADLERYSPLFTWGRDEARGSLVTRMDLRS